MNEARFTKMCWDTVDAIKQYYTDSQIESAKASSILAYSRWKPYKRFVTSGNLVSVATAGSSTLNVIGGPWQINNLHSLDQFFPTIAETVNVISVIPADGNEDSNFPYYTLGLESPLAYTHIPGAYIANNQPGIPIYTAVSTYLMPSDWLNVDEDSFDLAIGAKSAPEAGIGFYGSAYAISSALTQDTYGDISNFSAGFGPGGANIFVPVPGGVGIAQWPQVNWTFYGGDGQQTYLYVSPQNTVPEPLFLQFWYYGCHTVNSVPWSDMDTCVLYVEYKAKLALAAQIAGDTEFAIGSRIFTDNPAPSAAELTKQAMNAYQRWQERIVFRPFAIGG